MVLDQFQGACDFGKTLAGEVVEIAGFENGRGAILDVLREAKLMARLEQARQRLRLLIDLHRDWPSHSEVDGQFVLFEQQVLSLVAVPN